MVLFKIEKKTRKQNARKNTVLNTFLWECKTQKIYGEQQYNTVEDLRDNIIAKFKLIRRRGIGRAVPNLKRLVHLFIQEKHRYFADSNLFLHICLNYYVFIFVLFFFHSLIFHCLFNVLFQSLVIIRYHAQLVSIVLNNVLSYHCFSGICRYLSVMKFRFHFVIIPAVKAN